VGGKLGVSEKGEGKGKVEGLVKKPRIREKTEECGENGSVWFAA